MLLLFMTLSCRNAWGSWPLCQESWSRTSADLNSSPMQELVTQPLKEFRKTKYSVTCFWFCFVFFCFFGLQLVAHGGSQARSQIRATAAGLRHSYSHSNSNIRSKLHLQSTPQLMANARSLTQWSARDWTLNLMVPSQICFCCATTGTPVVCF